MKKVVTVKGVTIGEGLPKICVPMAGQTLDELIEEAEYIKTIDTDIVEWRVDFFKDAKYIDKVTEALKYIRQYLAHKPIIFTFRTFKEGGKTEISEEFYFQLNKLIIETKMIDIVDIELFKDEEEIKKIIDLAHKNNVSVIISNHDFHRTPSKEEIILRLRKSIELGGDISKIAVMPISAEDVITLLDATRIMKEKFADQPMITMSMGGKGVISRLTGELFGSDITFAVAKKPSAPGQISVVDLRRIIQLLHDNM